MSRSRDHRTGLMRSPAFLAPALTAALLCLAVAGVTRQDHSIGDRMRAERIAVLLGAVPERFGSWISEEVPIPSDAIEILRPNALYCRRLMRLGGHEEVTLIIVHCADARDMGGHYPPICYRQLGWMLDLDRVERPQVECRPLNDPILTTYRFRRIGPGGQLATMTVLNLFIYPDGQTSADMFESDPLTGPSIRASRGLAQVQFVFASDLSDAEAVRIAGNVLNEFPREGLRALFGQAEEGAP